MRVIAQRILATLTMANDASLADAEADAESLGAVMHFFSLAWVDMIELTQRCQKIGLLVWIHTHPPFFLKPVCSYVVASSILFSLRVPSSACILMKRFPSSACVPSSCFLSTCVLFEFGHVEAVAVN